MESNQCHNRQAKAVIFNDRGNKIMLYQKELAIARKTREIRRRKSNDIVRKRIADEMDMW